MNDTRVPTQTSKTHPEVVARQGLDALMAGRSHVVAGSWRDEVQARA